MRRIEVLVEEPSAKEALDILLPKLIHGGVRFAVRNFGSKYKLLKELPARLAGYAKRIKKEEDLRILVLVDQDSDDCRALKQRLENMARERGLPTKSRPDAQGRQDVGEPAPLPEEAWDLQEQLSQDRGGAQDHPAPRPGSKSIAKLSAIPAWAGGVVVIRHTKSGLINITKPISRGCPLIKAYAKGIMVYLLNKAKFSLETAE